MGGTYEKRVSEGAVSIAFKGILYPLEAFIFISLNNKNKTKSKKKEIQKGSIPIKEGKNAEFPNDPGARDQPLIARSLARGLASS